MLRKSCLSLVDFASWLVNSVLNLCDRKGNLKRTLINATGQELFWGWLKLLLSEYMLATACLKGKL